MARKKKYNKKATIISVSLDEEVLDFIDLQAKKEHKSRSEFINILLKAFTESSSSYCEIMAKKSAQDLYYWKARMEAIKENPDLF